MAIRVHSCSTVNQHAAPCQCKRFEQCNIFKVSRCNVCRCVIDEKSVLIIICVLLPVESVNWYNCWRVCGRQWVGTYLYCICQSIIIYCNTIWGAAAFTYYLNKIWQSVAFCFKGNFNKANLFICPFFITKWK